MMHMDVGELLRNLEKINVDITARDQELVLTGAKEKVTPELISSIRQHKAEILDRLAGPGSMPDAFCPIEEQEYYNPSHHQKGEWDFATTRRKGEALFKIAIARMVPGLNVALLDTALMHVMKRHEALRANFIKVRGKLKLKIHAYDPQKYALGFFDLRGEADAADLAKARIEAETARMIDLQTEALFRMHVYQVNGTACIVVLYAEHIIYDQLCLDFLKDEVYANYHTLLAGKAVPVRTDTLQLKEFVAWKNRRLNSAANREYWRLRYQDNAYVYSFNAFYSVINHDGAFRRRKLKGKYVFTLTEELAGLSAFAAKLNISLFGAVLGSFVVFLSKMFGQRHVLASVLFLDRDRAELQNLVANCAEFVLLFNEIRPETDFNRVVLSVFNSLFEAAKFKYPWDAEKWQFGDKEIFKINYFKPDADEGQLVGNVPSEHLQTRTTSACKIPDSFLEIKEYTNALVFECRYAQYYYTPAMVEEMFGRYKTFLGGILSHGDTPVGSLLV
jgi:hypothetical protein